MGEEWFRRYSPAAQHEVRLVCFPHAGGAASSFVSLSRKLSPAVEVLAVQYPGRQDRRREEPIADIARLADLLADALESESGSPYAFFGHSMGAVIAYETARRLAPRPGPGPVRLFLSGRSAPETQPDPLDRMRDDADVIAAIRRLGGTGAAVLDDPEIMEMAMPALRADYRAIGSYAWVPSAPLDCPFSVLVGDSDPVVPTARAARWSAFTTADTQVRTFPGGHFYLDGCTDAVAGTITAALDVGVRAKSA
ncbi:thioesterase II family protein [Streptomyces sp. NPDC055287]